MSDLELYDVIDGELVDETCECGAEGELVIDPYAQEIYGVEERMVLCDDCYQDRCDDI